MLEKGNTGVNTWPADYLNKRAQEERIKRNRRILWLGKMAFPQMNTKKTRLMFVPNLAYMYQMPPTYSHPSEPRRETVTLEKWVCVGNHWQAKIWFTYSESRDTLIVKEESFVYQRKSELTEHKF
jgi:hypothetical protein